MTPTTPDGGASQPAAALAVPLVVPLPTSLHAAPVGAPVPGWVVLLGAVLGMWATIALGVAAIDRLLGRLSDVE